MDGLTIHQLQCFHAVVSEGGFQAAAAKLRRSHSSVFTSIKNLEGQLGLPLLDRAGYRVTLTEAGRSFHNRTRVVLHERVNARHLTRTEVPEPIDLIVCDVGFIGLRTVLPAALALAATTARLIALIKPQFEVGKARVGKHGVVRDPALHREVCETIAAWLGEQPGWRVEGIVESPIRGPEGNVEFLICARRTGT